MSPNSAAHQAPRQTRRSSTSPLATPHASHWLAPLIKPLPPTHRPPQTQAASPPPKTSCPTYRVLSVLSIGGNLGAGSTACAAVGTPTPRASARTAAAAAERSAVPRDGGAAAMDGRVAAGASTSRRPPPPRVSRGAATKAMATVGAQGGGKRRREGKGGVRRVGRGRRRAGRAVGRTGGDSVKSQAGGDALVQGSTIGLGRPRSAAWPHGSVCPSLAASRADCI